MGSKRTNYADNFKGEAPKTLTEHLFYGLTLDPEQIVFRDAIWDPQKLIVLCNSKAGTGKTLISLATANLLVQYGLYDSIVYVASPTQEQRQGYLPGDIASKSGPYMEPLLEAAVTIGINPYYITNDADNSTLNGDKEDKHYIRFTTDTYFRGINLENKVVIIDEAQNFYFDDLKKTLTRIHDTCKTIVIGHTLQCDLYKKPERSGFTPYLNAFNKIKETEPRVTVCELTTNHRGWVSTFCDNVAPTY